MPPQALAAIATLVSFASHGNRIELRLDHGSAEIEWLTPSTFRFRRALDGSLPQVPGAARAALEIEIDDTPGALLLRSRFLQVSIPKSGLLLRVRRADGTPLMADLSQPRAGEKGIAWERQSPAGARFYGLGPRTDLTLDLRGKAVRSRAPLLICTAGYGEYHYVPGDYRFDFTGADRYRVEAPAIDYGFYYGPTAKQIFEEHREVSVTAPAWAAVPDAPASWNTLQATLLGLVHGAMSALLAPQLSLRPYAGAPEELVQRARQLGSLVDDVSPGPLGLSDFRKQLESFFATYAAEAREKGFPIWHPLPFQFPEDPECARHADEFMLGDEMLVAPFYQPGGRRPIYLPQGTWTNLETNEALPGRRTVTVETRALPVFARNGTIVPLDSPGGTALHYFPRLAAEFFLLENDPADWTQVHAAPAGDVIRLEIEARKAKEYQWVIHHIDRPAEVSFGDRKYRQVPFPALLTPGTWWYDTARRNLNVRVTVAAGEDSILNVMFP